jgi:hypothetical protein
MGKLTTLSYYHILYDVNIMMIGNTMMIYCNFLLTPKQTDDDSTYSIGFHVVTFGGPQQPA